MDTPGVGRGLLELTRPVNALAAGVLTFVGAFVAGGLDAPVPVGLAVGATVLAVGAGNAVNDYFDREIDRINAPKRPIPRGAVSPTLALAFGLLLFLAAVVMALTLPPLAVAVAGVNLAALLAYTELFKGLPGVGNAVVAYLGGSTFLFGAAAVGAVTIDGGLVDPVAAGPIVLFALAALSTFAREVIKDVEDVAGDRVEGLSTLPVVAGERRSLAFATAVLAVAVAASPLPYLVGDFGVVYLLLVVPADALMVVAAARAFDDPARGQRLLKYGMFLATAAFVLGRAAVVARPGGVLP